MPAPEKRHIHKDYDTTFCGLDASHIPMTFDENESNCADCKKLAKEFQVKVEQDKQLREGAARLRDAARAAAHLEQVKLETVNARKREAALAKIHSEMADRQRAKEAKQQ